MKRLLLCGLLIALAITPALAIDSEITPTITPIFVDYTATNQSTLVSHTYEIHRINQGDAVYLGDHIDISGVVAGNKALVWFRSGFNDPSEVPYVIPLPDTKAAFYDFYIDPAIFSDKTGDWFKWNGYFEPSGNTHAFYVVANYRTETLTWSNGTVINKTEFMPGNYTVHPEPIPDILPQKRVSDYLTVHGQGFNVTTKGPSKLWLFGRVDRLYALDFVDNQSILTSGQIQSLETGTYKMLTQYPGENKAYDVLYNPNENAIGLRKSPWEKAITTPLEGIAPVLAIEHVTDMLDATDDTYKVRDLVIQEPLIQIISMEQAVTQDAKHYYQNSNLRGNVSVFEIKGYTNVLPGTNLYFALDESKQPKKILWFNATAKGKYEGDMRMFEVYIPVYWEDMKEGMHTISGYTDVGGSIYRDFPVRISPDHSFIPNETVKWIDDRNPWVPPVTVTITIPVPGPTQIVTVIQTPDQNQLNLSAIEAQRVIKAEEDAKFQSNVWSWLVTIGVCALLLVIIGYGLSVYRRVRK